MEIVNDVYKYECKSHIKKLAPTERTKTTKKFIPNEFEIIARYLISGDKKTNKDCAYFKRYVDGKINLDECLKLFKRNHKFDYLDKRLFERWLASLGWVLDEQG